MGPYKDDSSMFTLVALSTGIAIAYGAWRLWLRPHLEKNRKPFDDVPMLPGGHFLLGHIRDLRFSDDLDKMQASLDLAGEKGRIGIWTFSRPGLLLYRWEDARAVLQSESNREPNPIVRKLIGAFAGMSNILFLNGRQWKAHRSAILKSFSPSNLAEARNAMVQTTQVFVESVKKRIKSESGSWECTITPLMNYITFDIFGLAAFSHRFGSCEALEPSGVSRIFEEIGEDQVHRFKTNPLKPTNYFFSIPTARNIAASKKIRELRSFVANAIEERKSEPLKQNDVLSNLITAEELAHDGVMSTETLSDTVITALFAGHDTTSSTLSYALYLVSQHPDVEAKCVEEINSVTSFGDSDNLIYCSAVIQETLRLYPAAPITARDPTKAITLPDGFVVPAGVRAMVPIWMIHRNPANFPRPHEFLPERWVMKSEDGAKWVDRDPADESSPVPPGNPKALIPFSFGARNCPGMKFASQEAVIVLAGLLKNFRFEVVPGYKLQAISTGPVQHPKDGLPMKISLRDAE